MGVQLILENVLETGNGGPFETEKKLARNGEKLQTECSRRYFQAQLRGGAEKFANFPYNGESDYEKGWKRGIWESQIRNSERPPLGAPMPSRDVLGYVHAGSFRHDECSYCFAVYNFLLFCRAICYP
jgi:hypothetical protein